MSSNRLASQTTWNSLKFIVTELIRQPVKDAVKEALREEAEIETADSSQGSMLRSGGESSGQSMMQSSDQSDSGHSRMLWMAVVAGAVGAGVVMRRWRSSGGGAWDESEAEQVTQSDTGYASEGEMQTTEAGGTEMDETSPEQ